MSPKSTGMTQPDTMFERYGGLPFVTRFVLRFYDRVLASSAALRSSPIPTCNGSSTARRNSSRRSWAARRAIPTRRCVKPTPICRSTIVPTTRGREPSTGSRPSLPDVLGPGPTIRARVAMEPSKIRQIVNVDGEDALDRPAARGACAMAAGQRARHCAARRSRPARISGAPSALAGRPAALVHHRARPGSMDSRRRARLPTVPCVACIGAQARKLL